MPAQPAEDQGGDSTPPPVHVQGEAAREEGHLMRTYQEEQGEQCLRCPRTYYVLVVVALLCLVLFCIDVGTTSMPPAVPVKPLQGALLAKVRGVTRELDARLSTPGRCGVEDYSKGHVGCPEAEQGWLEYIKVIDRFVEVAPERHNAGIADKMREVSHNGRMLFGDLDVCASVGCDAATVTFALGRIKADLAEMDDLLPQLERLNCRGRGSSSLAARPANSTIAVPPELVGAKKRMDRFRRAAIAAVHPHYFDEHFVASDQATSLLYREVKFAVEPGVAGAASAAASYLGRAALLAAEGECTVAPPACVVTAVGFLGLCATAAMIVYMLPSSQVVVNKLAEDTFNHELTSFQSDLRIIEDDLNDAKRITDLIFLSDSAMKKEMAISVQRSVAGIEMEVRNIVDISNEIIDTTVKLHQQDEANYRQYKACDAWLAPCIAASRPPARMVPKNIGDGAEALREALLRWGADLLVITSCAQSVDGGICDPIVIDNKMDLAKTKFHAMFEMWEEFKEGICSYHKWTVCDSNSMLVNLDALATNNAQRGYATVQAAPLALLGALAIGMTVHRVKRRGKARSIAQRPLLG
eukprot:CAMPEP_0204514130 /NCGR_PEP_ID=MMETSP0661-20131031/1873_1 /ASSEMBLY_ACC=CAM_ASM_000606 /TAXON_ID=109239 /ORGANISM="Alexandrium margalefi, Strain AMGDE01CS-322" /LENGTH=582 /DNA_ID=CAMNT_0051519355 /DNA_START=77 /DNA_END=1825 /DNA_ORIENTATION=+